MNDLNLAYLLDPTFQLVNTAGKPLTDGWLEVYIHGTRDKYYCYSDFEGTLHPFKIPLDSLGSNIVLASVDNAYDVYVYNKFGALVLSRYNVKPGAGGIGLDITSSDGSIVITQDGGNVDLSVSSLEPCVVIAKSSRTSNGIFELTEISHVGDLARIVNGQLTLDTGWWHYDADCTLDYTGADDLYDNLKITLSLSGEAEAISVDTHNYTIGHKDRISLSGDLHVTDDGQTCTIRVENMPPATLYIDKLSFHCIAKPGVYQPVDIVAGDGITVDDNNVVSVDDTIQRKLTEGEGITIDDNNVISATGSVVYINYRDYDYNDVKQIIENGQYPVLTDGYTKKILVDAAPYNGEYIYKFMNIGSFTGGIHQQNDFTTIKVLTLSPDGWDSQHEYTASLTSQGYVDWEVGMKEDKLESNDGTVLITRNDTFRYTNIEATNKAIDTTEAPENWTYHSMIADLNICWQHPEGRVNLDTTKIKYYELIGGSIPSGRSINVTVTYSDDTTEVINIDNDSFESKTFLDESHLVWRLPDDVKEFWMNGQGTPFDTPELSMYEWIYIPAVVPHVRELAWKDEAGGSYEGGTNISIDGNVINCDIEIDSSASGSSNNPISNSAMVTFVNSSVGTNTAYFLGTSDASEFSEFYAWLNTLNPTNNDYVFWETVDNEGHPIYKRYKYNASDALWHYEYELNNSSFTAVQWSAINSGLTSSDKTKLNGIEAGAQVNVQADWNASVALPSGILNKPTVPTASTSNPLMDGAASYGSGTSYARSNHRHPTDTSRQAALPTSGTAADTYAINISGNAATATKAAGANFKVLGNGTEAQLEVKYDSNTPSVIMDAVSSARGIWASGLAGAQYGKWALRIDNSSNEVELYGNSDTATKLKSGSVFCSTQHSKWYKIATFRQTNSNTNSSVGAAISVIQGDLAFKSAGGKTEFGIYNFIERRSGTDTQWSYYNKRNEYVAIGELTGISFGIVPSIVNSCLNIDVYVKCNTLDYNNFTFTVLNSYGFGNDSQEKTVDVTLYNPVSTDGVSTVSGLLTASSRALYPAEIVSALPASPEDGVMYLIPET